MTTDFKVLNETQDYWVVDKAPGCLVIPGRNPNDQSPILVSWLEKQFSMKPYVVHRIDRDTSGLVLVAKTPEFHSIANQWFETHQVHKSYLALCKGRPFIPSFRIKETIEGKSSLSDVETQEKFVDQFLAKVRIHTGRRHQIRIHLSHKGHPILGDTSYGGEKSIRLDSRFEGELLIPRVMLHASQLVLPTGEIFQSSLPEDFKSVLRMLRTLK